MNLPKEATITINGVTLSHAQAMSVRVAVTSFRFDLADPEQAELLGEIGKLYDARLIEVERLLVGENVSPAPSVVQEKTPRVVRSVPPKELKVVCRECGCTIAYVKNDIKSYSGTDISGGPDGCEWVNCPNCHKEITLRSW